jgi:hypothetical protein
MGDEQNGYAGYSEVEMPFEEPEATGAQLLQQQRCDSFAARTADHIRVSESCLFSLLPYQELARISGGWYEASAQGMLRGNWAAIEEWIRHQSAKAAEQGFALEDLLELLRICRSSVIELERWNTDVVSELDDVINETLAGTTGWATAPGLNYLLRRASPDLSAAAEARLTNTRSFERNRLQLPIRVRGVGKHSGLQEITRTQNISRGGLYFITEETYQLEQVLDVSYPYWKEDGAINCDYSAKVVRLDRLPDKKWGVAIHFSATLGKSR